MPYRNRTYYPIEIDAALYRSLRQIAKAIRRGDPANTYAWIGTLERQLFCATRIDGLLRRTHRPRPLTPLPPKPPAKTYNRHGVEVNPIPPNERRAAEEADARQWRSHLEKLGVKPRGAGSGPLWP